MLLTLLSLDLSPFTLIQDTLSGISFVEDDILTARSLNSKMIDWTDRYDSCVYLGWLIKSQSALLLLFTWTPPVLLEVQPVGVQEEVGRVQVEAGLHVSVGWVVWGCRSASLTSELQG